MSDKRENSNSTEAKRNDPNVDWTESGKVKEKLPVEDVLEKSAT